MTIDPTSMPVGDHEERPAFLTRSLDFVAYEHDDATWHAAAGDFQCSYKVQGSLSGPSKNAPMRYRAWRSSDIQPFAWADTLEEIKDKVQSDFERCVLSAFGPTSGLARLLKPFADFADVFDDEHIVAMGNKPSDYDTTDRNSVSTGGRQGHETYRRVTIGDYRQIRDLARRLSQTKDAHLSDALGTDASQSPNHDEEDAMPPAPVM